MKSLDCMPTVRTPEASRTLAKAHPGILPSPLRDWVGNFDHVRFRGYLSVHFRFGLQSSCLRFAVDVTAHHARLGTWLLARLYQGSHLRPLNFMRLQGATLPEPDVRVSPHPALHSMIINQHCSHAPRDGVSGIGSPDLSPPRT